VIDDESTDAQDLAVAVRKPLGVVGLPPELDADDAHFLFAREAELIFPNRRDLLAVAVQLPDESATFVVMVYHAKSRLGGRTATDPRRDGAARAMLRVFERDFDGRGFILLGDFSDNPDDRSLNLLETGDPYAPGGPEEIDGPFLSNLTKRVCYAALNRRGRPINCRCSPISSSEGRNHPRHLSQRCVFSLYFPILTARMKAVNR
jgi:hypothetical protein